jgi:hypothetical protein
MAIISENHGEIVYNGNVILVDPNMVNVNTNMINSIPQYQDMHIFAELIAERRARTVITVDPKGITNIDKKNSEKAIVVNFLGNARETSSPNNLNFTTNWYDGSSPEGQQFEGFGITSIKVKISSSYVPQVDIQFVDLRGVAFFNQADSPYRILFDFPPPIFNLTIKGYYGKALRYQLHLVKYNSEFQASNGNFIIDAQFIAMTFAPLTDVLFRYAVNFPLIINNVSMNPVPSKKPVNTFELILKLKNLYSNYQTKINTDVEVAAYKDTQKLLDSANIGISILNNYANKDSYPKLNSYGTPLLLIRNLSITDINQELRLIQNTGEYDGIIQSVPSDGIQNPQQRLYVAFQIGSNIVISDIPDATVLVKKSYMVDILKEYRTDLINKTGAPITENDIPIPLEEGFTSNQDIKGINPNVTNSYVYLDVTDYYVKLYKQRSSLIIAKSEAMTSITEKINNMVIENLGMKPTIYNVFKLILDDVDTFFRTLRQTSIDAEIHHKTYKSLIVDDNFRDSGRGSEEIFAFPLIIKQEKVCNQTKETRRAPIEISNRLGGNIFPEMKLIDDFINTFLKQQRITEQYDMRGLQNADGSFKWIPISPADSNLAAPLQTPYYGFDNTDGGSKSQPIDISTDPRLTEIFTKLLERYYILSQNSYAFRFYYNDEINKSLVKLFSESEAINLSLSITNTDYTKLLFTAATQFKSNIQGFYDYLKEFAPAIYEFTQEDKPSIKVADGGDYLSTNKKSNEYIGLVLNPESMILFPENAQSSPVTDFLTKSKKNWWQKIWANNSSVAASYYRFTEQNVFYIKDGSENQSNISSSNIDNNTRYLGFAKLGLECDEEKVKFITNNNFNSKSIDKLTLINDMLKIQSSSNQAIISAGGTITPGSENLNILNNIINVWVDQLARHDDMIYEKIINWENKELFNSRLSALVLTSNFGYTLSPFNIYPSDLNKYIFSLPAAIEIPNFLPHYIGALIGIDEFDENYKTIYNFYTKGEGRLLSSGGIYTFADIVDVNNQLSPKDKKLFQNDFNSFYGMTDSDRESTIYWSIVQQLNALYIEVSGKTTTLNDKIALYRKLLTEKYYETIIQPLITRTTLLNFSNLTFDTDFYYSKGYICLKTTIDDSKISDTSTITTYAKIRKTTDDNFFTNFFSELSTRIKATETKLLNQEQEFKKLTGDEDIITQTYYSFKNINDKWLSGPKKNITNLGYPPYENEQNPYTNSPYELINLFAFVDRAMNPIGDTIINPETLVELLDDQNVSVFTVISQLLSKNGFEFFPLQNFMNIGNTDDWRQSFLIDTEGIVKQGPIFVCMYIGGESSYPTGIGKYGDFKDDGIVDIIDPGVSDFSTKDCDSIVPDDDDQVNKLPNFPWRQVRAFRVKFGEQNQSMFTDIKIDSKEYPETNESLVILSRLAGDNKQQAPIPKGQNLYNLYENRSYKATVTGLGNAMIQPTQYFQIENVPLFNGAYIILNVEHSIEPNKMTTSFSGTKILKYPIPRVLQAASIVGFEGGNTDETNSAIATASDITLGVGTAGNPKQAQFNSMYYFKIQ